MAKKKTTRSVAAKPAARRVRRKTTHHKVHTYRRNPLPPRAKGLFQESVKPALIGALGALAVDVAVAKLPLPESLKVGVIRHPVRAAGAIGIAMLAEKFGLKHEHAVALARGGLTIVAHDVIKSVVRNQFPALALEAYEGEIGDIGDFAGDIAGLGENYALAHDGEFSVNGLSDVGATEYEEAYVV